MRSIKFTAQRLGRFCAVTTAVLLSACGGGGDNDYLSNVSGNWRFLGTLSSNTCVAFSYLPVGTPFDLFLKLTQDGTAVSAQKTGGVLWSERPIEEGKAAGTYSNNKIALDAQFVNEQAVTSPPFVFPEGVTSSACVLEIRGGLDINVTSATHGVGGVTANVTRKTTGGSCDAWLQPIPCQMKISGSWTKLN